jgi:hypothetical protein
MIILTSQKHLWFYYPGIKTPATDNIGIPLSTEATQVEYLAICC